jgi:hypothetical protein
MSSASHLTESDLKNWDLIQVFEGVLEDVFSKATLHPSFKDPRRNLQYRPYLSLFLFGLFNPTVQSMRALCSLTGLQRVQQQFNVGCVKPPRFSEMQHLIDPELLRQVFLKIVQSTGGNPNADARLVHPNLIAQDGSLWSALPRMGWAGYGVGKNADANGVRLHLRFHVTEDKPVDARVSQGNSCERRALRQMCQIGQTTVGDRYYGQDYTLFRNIDPKGAFFVFRIKEDAVVNVVEELPLQAQEQKAGVVRHAWVKLGRNVRSMPVRLIELRVENKHLLLVTNLSVEKADAALIGLVYKRRWSIELFFRWVKCILGCRHFFAESAQGAAMELYLALIAALLFQHYTGKRPGRRVMEMIHMYLLGWASAQELARFLEEQAQKETAVKKS